MSPEAVAVELRGRPRFENSVYFAQNVIVGGFTMAGQSDIKKGNEAQTLGSAGFIIGAVLIAIGNIWVTMAGLGNPMEALGKFSENVHVLRIVTLLITLGYWAVLIGTIGVQRTIGDDGALWARVGLSFMIMGGTLWTLGMSLDITYSNLISNWLAAADADKEFARTLITIYSPTIGIGRGLFPMNVMSNWLAFGFVGLGVLRGSVYPRWMGWSGVALGGIGLPIGALMAFVGREPIWDYFTILSFLTIFWILALGVRMARRAR